MEPFELGCLTISFFGSKWATLIQSERWFVAENLIRKFLDKSYLQLVQDEHDPAEMLSMIRNYRDPKTSAAAMEAFDALKFWTYDRSKDATQNVARVRSNGHEI